MPYISINASKPITDETRNVLQKEIAGNMEIIPGKTAANTFICISDNYSFYRETQAIEAAFIDIRLYKESPDDAKKAFAMKMFDIIDTVLGIPPTNVQMNFTEQPCWASNGSFF